MTGTAGRMFGLVALMISAMSSGGRASQSPTEAGPQTPVLRASIDQVVVDVVVTDARGAPVTGLTAADFEILERGKPQAIGTFSEISLPLVVGPETAAAPIASDVRSNQRVGERRFYVLVLDDENVPLDNTGDVRKAAHAFVRRLVQPGDLVAVVTSGGLGDGMREFTEDMSLVDAAIDRFAGHIPPVSLTLQQFGSAGGALDAVPRGSGREHSSDRIADSNANSDASADQLSRGGAALRTLANLTDALAGVSGRKAVIFVSTGIALNPGNWSTQEQESVLRQVVDGAARANVTIYTVDPGGLRHHDDIMGARRTPEQLQRGAPGTNRRDRAAMLGALASSTGGTATIDTNNPLPGLEGVARDSSHYYLLGYASTDARRDGRFRSIEVRARRSGLTVRARPGYYAPKDRRGTEKNPPSDPVSPIAADLQALVARPVGTAGLALTAHAMMLPVATGNVRVIVEVAPGALAAGAAGDEPANVIDFTMLPVLPGGHTLPSVDGRIALGAAEIDGIRQFGVRFVQPITLPAGAYQLRVALRERARGTTGSVYCDLTVPDLRKSGLVMSDLVLSASGAGRMPSATIDRRLSEMLDGPPTTARTFGADQTLRAYVELADAKNRGVELVTIVRDAGGRELLRRPEPTTSTRPSAGDRLGYAIDLPLQPFAPGRYVLRVEARGTATSAPVAREVAFGVVR